MLGKQFCRAFLIAVLSLVCQQTMGSTVTIVDVYAYGETSVSRTSIGGYGPDYTVNAFDQQQAYPSAGSPDDLAVAIDSTALPGETLNYANAGGLFGWSTVSESGFAFAGEYASHVDAGMYASAGSYSTQDVVFNVTGSIRVDVGWEQLVTSAANFSSAVVLSYYQGGYIPFSGPGIDTDLYNVAQSGYAILDDGVYSLSFSHSNYSSSGFNRITGDVFPAQTGESSVSYAVGFSEAAVPVPAAVWLFGSGVLGLLGVSRAKLR